MGKVQQDQISEQIVKATKQIKSKQINKQIIMVLKGIKEKRKKEKIEFKRKEEILKKEIEHHIETARSTEDNAEKIRAELEKIRKKSKEKSEISTGAQTSFT